MTKPLVCLKLFLGKITFNITIYRFHRKIFPSTKSGTWPDARVNDQRSKSN